MDRAGTVFEEDASIEVFQNVAIALNWRGFEPEGGLEEAGIRVNGDEVTMTDSPATSTNKVDLLEIQNAQRHFYR